MPESKEPWYKTLGYFALGLIGVVVMAIIGISVETIITWYLTKGF